MGGVVNPAGSGIRCGLKGLGSGPADEFGSTIFPRWPARSRFVEFN
jgi:hypothetical protein